MNCTRCEGTGFLNAEQLESALGEELRKRLLTAREQIDSESAQRILDRWYTEENHDVQICDCCGNGEEWYGIPGEHYGPYDHSGLDGPYAYNGGLCECH